MPSASRLLSLALFVVITWGVTRVALAERFPKVRNLTASYVSKRDKVKLNWSDSNGASSYSYRVTDSEGNVLFRGKTTKSKKKVSASSLTSGSEYTVKVRVTKNGSTKASKWKSTNYTHVRNATSGTGVIQTENSSGRSGRYYLPTGFNGRALPLMVAFHGTGGSGADMVSVFQDLADEFSFIIVAPDSRQSPGGSFTWEVGTTQGEVTDDYTHALACIEEVLSFANVTSASEFILAAGYSGGASSGPYLSTNDSTFTHFAVLHGGVFVGGLGENIVPGWLSTGTTDSLRPPSELQGYVTSLTNAGFSDVTSQEYSGGHSISSSEKEELVEWWLQG